MMFNDNRLFRLINERKEKLIFICLLMVLSLITPSYGQGQSTGEYFTMDHSSASYQLNNHTKMDTLNINLDAFKKSNWSEIELKNVELITDFVQHLMNNHDFTYVLKNFDNSAYLQHSRGIPDGIKALVEYVEGFAKRFPEYTYDVKHIYVDGDYVIFHSHATVKKKHRGNDKKGFNIKDTWKIKNGEIVEHWDSIQPIDGFMRFYTWLIGGKILNSNGVF